MTFAVAKADDDDHAGHHCSFALSVRSQNQLQEGRRGSLCVSRRLISASGEVQVVDAIDGDPVAADEGGVNS